MGAPDNELIAEVSLVTEGFTESKDLASKIVSLFKLSRQLLSPQQHYDWGLRALKAVLNSGGRIIQSYKVGGNEGASFVHLKMFPDRELNPSHSSPPTSRCIVYAFPPLHYTTYYTLFLPWLLPGLLLIMLTLSLLPLVLPLKFTSTLH